MTLTKFLLERIAEDVEDITEAELNEPKRIDGTTLGGYWEVEERHGFRYLAIRRARALAECEAKRRIVAQRERSDRSANEGEWAMGYSDANYEALLALALPYADHPDYQQEWAL